MYLNRTSRYSSQMPFYANVSSNIHLGPWYLFIFHIKIIISPKNLQCNRFKSFFSSFLYHQQIRKFRNSYDYQLIACSYYRTIIIKITKTIFLNNFLTLYTTQPMLLFAFISLSKYLLFIN